MTENARIINVTPLSGWQCMLEDAAMDLGKQADAIGDAALVMPWGADGREELLCAMLALSLAAAALRRLKRQIR